MFSYRNQTNFMTRIKNTGERFFVYLRELYCISEKSKRKNKLHKLNPRRSFLTPGVIVFFLLFLRFDIFRIKSLLKLMEKTRLTLKFSQEIRTETRISNFKNVQLVGIFGGDMFRIIYVKGDMFCIILDIYLKGDFSGQLSFHFIYLITLIGQK